MEKPSVRNRLRSIAKYGPNMQLHAEKHFQIPHASDGHGAFLDGANACRGPHKRLFKPRCAHAYLHSKSVRAAQNARLLGRYCFRYILITMFFPVYAVCNLFQRLCFAGGSWAGGISAALPAA